MADKPTSQRPGVTILGVQFDPTKNGTKRYQVQCSDGKKYSTFDEAAATVAQNLVNQPGTLIVEHNNQYENYGGFIPGGAVQQGGFAQAPVAQPGFVPQPAPQVGGFVPVPAPNFQDAKEVEIRRSVAVKAAAEIIAAAAGTGIYLTDEGALDAEKVASDLFALTAKIGPYLANGPGGAPASAPIEDAPPLPPGVSPAQVQEWAAAENPAAGAAVQVGAPVAVEAAAPAVAPAAEGASY